MNLQENLSRAKILIRERAFDARLDFAAFRNRDPQVHAALQNLAQTGYHAIEGYWDSKTVDHWETRLEERHAQLKASGKKFDSIDREGAFRWRGFQDEFPELKLLYGEDPFIQTVAKEFLGSRFIEYQIMYQRTYLAEQDLERRYKEHEFVGLGRDGFHTDGFGARFKTVILFSDVSEENGPLFYCPETQRLRNDVPGALKLRKLVKHSLAPKRDQTLLYCSPEEAAENELDARAKPVLGKRGTLLFVDTHGWHRGSILKSGERKVLWNYWGTYNPFQQIMKRGMAKVQRITSAGAPIPVAETPDY